MPTLEWIGKSKVINHHQEVPYRVLNKKYTFNAKDSDNKIIHGDNLLALKSLLPQYEGKIDCIYIDPPYNTGAKEGQWVYSDNVDHPQIKKWLGEVVGAEGEDLSRHDKWLCMMYPRLKMLHKLMSDDGIIFISIDDNEYANLRLICDEIFGINNFISTFKWNRVKKAPSLSNTVRTKYEYILTYSKNKKLKLYGKRSYNEQAPLWHNPNKPTLLNFAAKSIEVSQNFEAGFYGGSYSVELFDNIIVNNNTNLNPVRIKAASAWGQEKIDKYISDGYKFQIKKSPKTVYVYLNNENNFIPPSDIISTEECGVLTNTDANNDLTNLGINFNYSKPNSLVNYLVNMICYNRKDAIVLDSFAGSGTTGHAVLDLNAQDDGNRKFILIEMMDYAENITAERVKRVINGYGDVKGLGGNFNYYELGEPLLINNKYINEKLSEDVIREFIYFSETKEKVKNQSKTESKYFLGKHNQVAYYFYYEKEKTTTLNHEFLSTIKTTASHYLIYADSNSLTEEEMLKFNISFKKIPRDITRF